MSLQRTVLFYVHHGTRLLKGRRESFYLMMLSVCMIVQGDTKKWELFKCLVAAMYSCQHYGTGVLSYRQPRHLVTMN
jgi:hypothetical protein